MRIEYNKLIRDKIPKIIQEAGKRYEIEVMGEDEYRLALLEKLVEEAQEVREAAPDKAIIELADLLEVIDGIIASSNIDRANLLSIKEKRYQERGGFKKRLKLLWAEE